MEWKKVREALGQSCFIVGLLGTFLVVVIGIVKIAELGIDRLIPMCQLLAMIVPILLIGLWLLKPFYD